MRCLVYLKPSEDLQRVISAYFDPSNFPKSGLHCTLWGFNIIRAEQDSLIMALSQIQANEFTLTTKDYQLFDNNSLVLRLSKTRRLQALHQAVVETSRKFDKSPDLFDEMVSRYGLEKYSPHISMGRANVISPESPKSLPTLKDLTFDVRKFYLAIKNGEDKDPNSKWEEVANFNLQRNYS